MRNVFKIYNDNNLLLKANGIQSNILETNDIILYQFNIEDNSFMNSRTYLSLVFNSVFNDFTVKIAQIFDVDINNINYNNIYNKFNSGENTVYFDKFTVKSNSSKTAEFNISNSVKDNTMYIVVFIESCPVNNQITVPIATIDIMTSIRNSKHNILYLDDSNILGVNLENGLPIYNDNLYSYKTDLIEFPITFGSLNNDRLIYHHISSNYSFSLNFEAVLSYFYDDTGAKTSIGLSDNTEIVKLFKIIDNLDQNTIDKIETIKTKTINAMRDYLHKKNYEEFSDDIIKYNENEIIIDNLNINSNYLVAKSNQYSQTIVDFDVYLDYLCDGIVTVYNSDGTIYVYNKYGFRGDYHEQMLHLSEIVYPNNESIYLTNEKIDFGSNVEFIYKTTKLTPCNIELKYITNNNNDLYSGKKIIEEVDFKNDFRKVTFEYGSSLIDDFNNSAEYIRYKLIDYKEQENNKILKDIKVYLNERIICRVEDYISNIGYDLIYTYDESATYINSLEVSKYLFNNYSKITVLNTSIIVYQDYAIVTDITHDKKTIYLYDEYKNIKEVIYNDVAQISYSYNDDDLKIKQSHKKLKYQEIQNYNFNGTLKYWLNNNAMVLRQNDNAGDKYIKLGGYYSLSQPLNLQSGYRYELHGHLKHISLNTGCRISIIGGYNIPSGNTNNLQWQDIHIYHDVDINANDWYTFSTDNLFIPNNAQDIDMYLVVEGASNIFIDYLNVICQDTSESCVQNYNFSSDLDGWSYGGTKPIVIDNTIPGVYALVEKNGYLSQQVQLDSGNCYILRGIIKQAEPSLNSTSTISLNINYSLNGTQNIQRCITLNKNINGWYEFTSEKVEIPKNATQIIGEIRLDSNETLFVKEIKITTENIVEDNLIKNGIFQNGDEDLTFDSLNIYDNFYVSNNVTLVSNSNSFGKSSVYKDKELKLHGSKNNDYPPRIVFREISTLGEKDDSISANILVKYNESIANKLKFFVQVYYNNTDFDEYIVYPTSNFKYYQTLTNNIIAKNDYVKIKIGINFTGYSDCYITGFELYKYRNTYNYNYDNLLEATDINDSIIIYNKNMQVKNFVGKNGQYYEYKYDGHGHMVEQLDIFGNTISKLYANNRLIRETQSLTNNDVYTNTYSYEDNTELDDKLMILKTNTYGHTFTTKYDYLYRLNEIMYPNEHVLTNLYNNIDQLKEVSSNNGNNYQNKLTYKNDLLNVINPGNVTDQEKLYVYEYDEYKRISEIKLKSTILYKYHYNVNNLVEKVETLTGNYRNVYDNKHRVIKVLYATLENPNQYSTIYNIIYDRFDNIMYFNDIIDNSTLHYEYDTNNNIKNITKVEDNYFIKYEYDNYQNLMSKNFNDLTSYNKIEYFNLVDGKNINQKDSIVPIIRDYNAEIINAISYYNGLYGITKSFNTSVDRIYDEDLNKKVLRFNKDSNYIEYDLSTWNKNKDSQSNISANSIKNLKKDFEYNKTFSLWIKPKSPISLSTLIAFTVEDSLDNSIKLNLNANGKVEFKNSENTFIISENSVNVNEWNFISLSLIKDQAEDIITYELCVNNAFKSVLAPLEFSVMKLNKIGIGEERTKPTRSVEFDIALITIDSHIHNRTSLNKLYDCTKEFVFTRNENEFGLLFNLNNNEYKHLSKCDVYGRICNKQFLSNNNISLNKVYSYSNSQLVSEETNGEETVYSYNCMKNIM